MGLPAYATKMAQNKTDIYVGEISLGNRITAVPSALEPPRELPLSAVDNLDIVGERKDGGIDMVVVTTRPLDASEEICNLLGEKLNAYLRAATHENFAKLYPAAARGRVRIFVSDKHAISDRARQVVKTFAAEALARNVEVQLGGPVA